MGFSDGLGSRKRSPEYRFVSRFRQRRLLSLLMRQRLYGTFDALVGESDAFMYPEHLTELAREGRWEKAIQYISRFLPTDRRLGVHGRALLHFLRVHRAIDAIFAGAPERGALNAALKICFAQESVRSQGITKLRAILWSLIIHTESRDSVDLERVRDKAASIIDDLASQTPELKQHMKYARGPVKPHNVLPIGFGFRPRRHVKRGHFPGSVLVRHYLRKKRILPSSTSSHCEALSSASLIKAKGWMVDLVDTSLKAGKRNQGSPLQSVPNKGAPVGPVSLTNLGTLRSPATHSGMSSDTNIELKIKEWGVYLTDDRLEAWPDMSQGYPPIRPSVDKDVARLSQTIPGTLTRPTESSATPSLTVTKEDVPYLFQVPYNLKDPARDHWISPVTDAGVLPSEAMSAMWPFHPLISTVKNAGALSLEAMPANRASPSEYSMISIVENRGALPTPSENSLISTVTNAGTYKHLSPEQCYTENAYQSFSPRKNPRIELTTVGQGHNPKRQRTTLASLIECAAEDHLSACSLVHN